MQHWKKLHDVVREFVRQHPLSLSLSQAMEIGSFDTQAQAQAQAQCTYI